ncbi:AraC-like DNA-binding protein [Kibdelosporangium banguiense]|uniref:AraC-like DNA-binding protein n=1 Tax=Kibdelosporangium banguiense TaxID=1365924 RepID=A0ABS4TTZ3_9PSEU|nr:AraC family transcriptional regulator [Kibdelosporangium banguiense]MBP2327877.1 AraC-like DNA-binding protein [Kibdelosporangium banguiense]
MTDEPPLFRHEGAHTRDVDEARELVTRAFCTHQLLPLDGHGVLDARFHSVRLGDVGLNYLDYGAEVRIAPGQLQDFFLVQMPLAGHAEIICGKDSVLSDPLMASVPAPDRDLVMRWSANNPQLIVWIDREALERHLSKMLGRPLAQPLRFDLGMDMTQQAIRSWRNVVELMRSEIDMDGAIPTEPLAMTELQRLLFSQLLIAQPNNYSAALHRDPAPSAPKVIKQAAELIDAHAAEPLTVEDVAEAVGIGVRALQDGFRRFLDTTPMNYLREVRLRRVRAELELADPARTNVTDVAMRWGFLHAGRFSVQYRQRFGESPSATLRG